MDSSSHEKKQTKGGGSMMSTFYSYDDNAGNLKEKKPSSGSIWSLRNYKKQIKNTTQNHHQEVDHSNKEEEERKKKNMKKFVEEARKSVSHVESNLTSVASFLNVKVLAVDMPGFMQVHAFRCARRTFDSLEKFSSKHMAYHMKKEFDRVYGPAWHCIVGSSFGSFVTYSTGCFIYFSMEKIYILVFKTKVQKASE